ncbi:MAG: thioredoxin family protein [Planctomycetes bacterium]|nr:thioredoxin family protein [Planctomycetota bacterium]
MIKNLIASTLAVLAFVWLTQLTQAAQPRQPRLFTETSIEKGWQIASQQQQPMLVMFTSDSCMYCKKMLAETYGHPAIQQMLAGNTQTVLAHAEDYRGLIKKLGIRGFPSSVLISPQGDVLEFMEGFVPPKEFAKRISPLLKAHARQARASNLPQQTTGR